MITNTSEIMSTFNPTVSWHDGFTKSSFAHVRKSMNWMMCNSGDGVRYCEGLVRLECAPCSACYHVNLPPQGSLQTQL